MSNSYITEDEIRELLLDNVGEDATSGRELLRSTIPTRNNGSTIGSVMYSLSGIPPRGYALYIPGLDRLNVYTPGGERFDCREDVAGVVEIDAVSQTIVETLQEQDTCTREDLREAVATDVVVVGHTATVVAIDAVFEKILAALQSRGVLVEDDQEELFRLAV